MHNLTAFQNVQLPLLYGRSADTKTAPIKALEIVGLTHRKFHKPNELSGGERQRVAIARAIVTNPQILMADEPTGNLDTTTGNQIMQIFTDLHQNGATIILVTHEPDIANFAQRIITLKDGNIINDFYKKK